MYSQSELDPQNNPTVFETGGKERHRWVHRWWGKVLLVGLLLFLSLLLAFGIYVVRLVYLVKTGQINANEVFGEQTFVDLPTMATDDDPSLGPRDAKVVVVEFSDFQCPFCAEAQPVVKRILNDYGNQIRFVYRDFPLVDAHPQALAAALAANCALEQGKFWEMHDKIFENQTALEEVDLKRYAIQIGLNSVQFGNCFSSKKYLSEVEADFNDGVAAGVQATPTFFINGVLVRGALSYDAFQQIIVRELNR